MKIGIGIGLTTRQGVSGSSPLITATVTPSLGALSDGDTIASAMSANYDQTSNYSSTAGTISTVVAAATVNGVAALFTDTVDAGDVVAVTVTVTDSEANERVFNAGSRTVAGIAPTNDVAPSIAGDTSLGDTLTVTAGTWSGAPAPTLAYQWLRGGVEITGETGTTYDITLADSGAEITVRETATNSEGSGSAVSNAITADTFTAPVNTVAPSIGGDTAVGSTLTRTTGTWSGNPTPAISGQWQRDGAAISGATGATYVTVEADEGADITYLETATNAVGSASQASNAITVTAASAFTPASLFASGEEGAWYEPSPTTCFTDTAGTTPAAVGDSVARINDLSSNGNHATQATAAARPILARVPPRGRVNELSETDALATQSVTVTAAQRTLSFTGTGTVTLTGASTAGPLVGTGAGDRVSLTFTPSAGSLTLTVLGTVTDAQLELGASATTYQFVADSLGYDITEAGVTSLDYLAFDGSDDFMTVGTNADWHYLHDGTGSMAAFAVRTAEVANPNDISFVFSTNNANPAARGSYVSVDDRSAASRNDAWNIRVTNTTASPTPVFEAANNTISDIDGNSVFVFQHGTAETPDYTFRENGIVVYSGSYGDAPASGNSDTALIIGASDTTGTNSLNGRLFAAIVRGAASTAQELSDTESYLAAKSGVTL